jgi:hypothetical protein
MRIGTARACVSTDTSVSRSMGMRVDAARIELMAVSATAAAAHRLADLVSAGVSVSVSAWACVLMQLGWSS